MAKFTKEKLMNINSKCANGFKLVRMKREELKPIYDNAKSFYKKAFVEKCNDKIRLYSLWWKRCKIMYVFEVGKIKGGLLKATEKIEFSSRDEAVGFYQKRSATFGNDKGEYMRLYRLGCYDDKLKDYRLYSPLYYLKEGTESKFEEVKEV